MRARAWLCVAALPVSALAGACGGGDDDSSEPASERVSVLKVTDCCWAGVCCAETIAAHRRAAGSKNAYLRMNPFLSIQVSLAFDVVQVEG